MILILSVPGSGTHALMNMFEAMNMPRKIGFEHHHLPKTDYRRDLPILIPVRDPILSLLSRHTLISPVRSGHIEEMVDGWLQAPTIPGAHYFPLGTYTPTDHTIPPAKYDYLNGNPRLVIDIFGEDLLHKLAQIAPWVRSLGIEAFRFGLDSI